MQKQQARPATPPGKLSWFNGFFIRHAWAFPQVAGYGGIRSFRDAWRARFEREDIQLLEALCASRQMAARPEYRGLPAPVGRLNQVNGITA